jgi:hypothetical protein
MCSKAGKLRKSGYRVSHMHGNAYAARPVSYGNLAMASLQYLRREPQNNEANCTSRADIITHAGPQANKEGLTSDVMVGL